MAQDKEDIIEGDIIEEYIVEENEPIIEQNSNLSEKSKKLIEKIENLSQKIEQEKSPLKRHVLSFQVKMILAKIQREIERQNIRAEYDDKRDYILERKNKREDKYADEIADINAEIRKLKRTLRANEEYDSKSKNFLYPDRYVEQLGGVENLTKKLKESKNPSTQQAAKKNKWNGRKKSKIRQIIWKIKW